MADDNLDQDALAAEWAASLGEEDDGAVDPFEAAQSASATQESNAPLAEDSGDSEEDALAAEWAAALADSELNDVKAEKKEQLYQTASEANFLDMTEKSKAPRTDTQRHDLDFILDIPLDISVELGRTRLLINELLQLGQGSVVELNKLAGEPLEVYVNGKLIARGEAVVINEKFGVRLTDIISPTERVKQLS